MFSAFCCSWPLARGVAGLVAGATRQCRYPVVVLWSGTRFSEDVAGRRDGRRVMIYFGQDGCPTAELLTTNFSRPEIVDKDARARFEQPRSISGATVR